MRAINLLRNSTSRKYSTADTAIQPRLEHDAGRMLPETPHRFAENSLGRTSYVQQMWFMNKAIETRSKGKLKCESANIRTNRRCDKSDD